MLANIVVTFLIYSTLIVGNGLRIPTSIMLLTGKSLSDDKNKAETLLQDIRLFCYFAYYKQR